MTNLVNIPEESSSLSQYFFKLAKRWNAFSTWASHVVTHRTTSQARLSLTSPSGREGVRLSVI